MSIDAAREITKRIRCTMAVAWTCIVEAYNGRAWLALNYPSWDEYCAAEFDGARLRLPREERRDVVGSLREAGLSLRAIESATGVSKKTVISDIKVVESTPPETAAVEVTTARKSVAGTDGKVYQLHPKSKRAEWIDTDRHAGRKWSRHITSSRIVKAIRDVAWQMQPTPLIDEIRCSDLDIELIESTISACKAAAAESNRIARMLMLERDRRNSQAATS